MSNPESRVIFSSKRSEGILQEQASSVQGLATADDPRFTQFFWENKTPFSNWVPLRGTTRDTVHYGGCERTLFWENGEGQYFEHAMALKQEGRLGGWKSGTEARGKRGIIVSQMSTMPVSLYCGEFFDHNACVILPKDFSCVDSMWLFCSSRDFYDKVREIDQSLKPSNNTFVKVNFDLEEWRKSSQIFYPRGLPRPYSDDPTQWIFHGHPCGSIVWSCEEKKLVHGPLRCNETVLQIAVARLLGYQWPAELDPQMELSSESREWVSKSQALNSHADKDGIVCLPAIGSELAASERLLNLLVAAYGDEWNPSILASLMTAADNSGKSLDVWLREKFFAQHCKVFQNRPFIWHIWDGLKDGFSALVNYQKLDRKNLETLTYTYLGEWINRQRKDISNKVDGAEEKLAAAENLKKRLELILEGEKPYDLFVRWKPVEEQPIGWEPDLNDGVRLNIRPFLTVPDVGKKGAGILREKPNIKWEKDRGKDVESSPWFHLFNGDRINDHHLSLAEKRQARAKEEKG